MLVVRNEILQHTTGEFERFRYTLQRSKLQKKLIPVEAKILCQTSTRSDAVIFYSQLYYQTRKIKEYDRSLHFKTYVLIVFKYVFAHYAASSLL